LAEVAGDAALLVNPESVEELAVALRALATDTEFEGGIQPEGPTASLSIFMAESCGKHLEGLQGIVLAGFFVHGDFQGAQELVVLA